MSQPALDKALQLIKTLRDPENGCAWDIQQTHETIAPYAIDEAHEAMEALQEGDMEEFKKELGDLLWQVVYQAEIASEQGLFDFNDVAQALVDKMERRYKPIFAGDRTDLEEIKKHWLAVKAEERAEKALKS